MAFRCSRYQAVAIKKVMSTVMSGLVAAGTLGALTFSSSDAQAQSRSAGARGTNGVRGTPGVRGQGGGVRSPTFHSGPRLRVVIGAPVFVSPWWGYPYASYYDYGYAYPPSYYDPAAVYVQQQPPVYIERHAPVSTPQPQPEQYWYHCQDSKTYFPYVQKCATSWQRVMPHGPQ